jgi:hypothetical protein
MPPFDAFATIGHPSRISCALSSSSLPYVTSEQDGELIFDGLGKHTVVVSEFFQLLHHGPDPEGFVARHSVEDDGIEWPGLLPAHITASNFGEAFVALYLLVEFPARPHRRLTGEVNIHRGTVLTVVYDK